MAADERKEKVLHTRIPAGLEEQIKRLAERLRVPVSNLVRNMLEDAMAMGRDALEMGRRVRDAGAGVAPPNGSAVAAFPDIYGWQRLTLNVNVPCARCGKELEAGDDAFVGLSDMARGERVFICPSCVPKPSRKTGGRRRKEI